MKPSEDKQLVKDLQYVVVGFLPDEDGYDEYNSYMDEIVAENVCKLFEDRGYMYVPPSMRDNIYKYVKSGKQSVVSNQKVPSNSMALDDLIADTN